MSTTAKASSRQRNRPVSAGSGSSESHEPGTPRSPNGGEVHFATWIGNDESRSATPSVSYGDFHDLRAQITVPKKHPIEKKSMEVRKEESRHVADGQNVKLIIPRNLDWGFGSDLNSRLRTTQKTPRNDVATMPFDMHRKVAGTWNVRWKLELSKQEPGIATNGDLIDMGKGWVIKHHPTRVRFVAASADHSRGREQLPGTRYRSGLWLAGSAPDAWGPPFLRGMVLRRWRR